MHSEGIINPIRVTPDSVYVKEASLDALKYVTSSEGIQMLSYSNNTFSNRESLYIRSVRIHESKMHYYLSKKLEEIMHLKPDENGFYVTDNRFFNYYMTLLAKSISEDKSLAVVSDSMVNNQLINMARFDKDVNYSYALDCTIPHVTLKQGILTNYVLNNIVISELTPLKDIVDFRKQHKDELARFRTNLSKLVEPINAVSSYEALQQRIRTIYEDEFMPAYNDLKHALSLSKIQWMFDNLSKLCVFSVSTTAIPMVLGLETPQALLLGGGISVASSVVAYNVEKKKALRKNPYTYLMKVSKEFAD